ANPASAFPCRGAHKLFPRAVQSTQKEHCICETTVRSLERKRIALRALGPQCAVSDLSRFRTGTGIVAWSGARLVQPVAADLRGPVLVRASDHRTQNPGLTRPAIERGIPQEGAPSRTMSAQA